MNTLKTGQVGRFAKIVLPLILLAAFSSSPVYAAKNNGGGGGTTTKVDCEAQYAQCIKNCGADSAGLCTAGCGASRVMCKLAYPQSHANGTIMH